LPAGIGAARVDTQLSDLAHAAGIAPRHEVISGYRSPATNAMLHATGHAASEHRHGPSAKVARRMTGRRVWGDGPLDLQHRI
jgi:hypothetical protein